MAKPEKSNKSAEESKPAESNGKNKKKPARSDGARETVESVVVAFILAFLVRTFEAEAFVIPTGSMAPTLYGRHIEFTCKQCGTHGVVGASSELRSEFNRASEYYKPRFRITSALCPNCRYDNPIFDANSNPKGLPAYKGDRILVNKFPYEFWDPKRWDVVVFKYPEDPKTNYIKRLVGLPGEQLEINGGDVYVRTGENAEFRIARKDDPYKQRQLQIMVYDNDKPARNLIKWGWPERWAALSPSVTESGDWSSDTSGWQSDYDARTFLFDGSANDENHWIRYRHFVPSQDDWNTFEAERSLDEQPLPQLISDFCPYNAYAQARNRSETGRDDALWVSDLTINFDVEIQRAEGHLIIELVDGDYRHRCRFDLQTGQVSLYYLSQGLRRGTSEEVALASSDAGLKGTGRHSVSFANVDHRLCLWIDGTLVEFDKSTEFTPPPSAAPGRHDLAPVGITASGGKVKISSLVLQRDIYYRSDQHVDSYTTRNEFGGESGHNSDREAPYYPLKQLLHDPAEWYASYSSNHSSARFDAMGPDEFFMMGDNSPHSQDSRLWSNNRGAKNRHAVPRSALVGKAFFVYWPHGIPFLNNGRGFGLPFWPLKGFSYQKTGPNTYPEDESPPEEPYPEFTVPFYPNVWRMHRIR